MNYYEKYLKYKNKYFQLKNQIGSSVGTVSYVYKRDMNVPIICNYQTPNRITVGDTFDFVGHLYLNNVQVAKADIKYEIVSIKNDILIYATTRYNFNNNKFVFAGKIESPNFNIINGVVQPYTTVLASLTNTQSNHPRSSFYEITGNGVGNVSF